VQTGDGRVANRTLEGQEKSQGTTMVSPDRINDVATFDGHV